MPSPSLCCCAPPSYAAICTSTRQSTKACSLINLRESHRAAAAATVRSHPEQAHHLHAHLCRRRHRRPLRCRACSECTLLPARLSTVVCLLLESLTRQRFFRSKSKKWSKQGQSNGQLHMREPYLAAPPPGASTQQCMVPSLQPHHSHPGPGPNSMQDTLLPFVPPKPAAAVEAMSRDLRGFSSAHAAESWSSLAAGAAPCGSVAPLGLGAH